MDGVLPPEAIRSANEFVRIVTTSNPATRKTTGKYRILSAEFKDKIGKYAAENGNTAAARHFSKELEKPLSEATIWEFKSRYLEELSRKRKADEHPIVESLPQKKRGRPLLLGDELDHKVQAYVQTLCNNGGSVTTAIVSVARGILMKVSRSMLS